MTPDILIQIVVQVPAMAITAYVLLRVLDRVLDMRAQERERFALAIDNVAEALRELQAWIIPAPTARTSGRKRR